MKAAKNCKYNRDCKVFLTHHAVDQCLLRTGKKPSAGYIRQRLMSKLRTGASVTNNSIDVFINDGIFAVCVPVQWGWLVVTVVNKNKGVEENKQKKSHV